jgi:hypothetical protein
MTDRSSFGEQQQRKVSQVEDALEREGMPRAKARRQAWNAVEEESGGDRKREKRRQRDRDDFERTGGNPKGTRLKAAKKRGAKDTKDKPIKPKKGGVHGAAKLNRAQARKKRVPATTHTKQGKQRRG